MNYIEFKENLKDFTVFSIKDIRRIEVSFCRRRLNEWQDKGYIIKVIRGYYIFSDLKIDENVLFEAANRIYSPSYISLGMALSYYGLIPESVYGVTSISTRRTYSFNTKFGRFYYKNLKSSLFFGYDIIKYNNKSFKIAKIEKALLDYFYLNPRIKTKEDFESLRIDKTVFLKKVNKKQFFMFLKRFMQKSLMKRMNLFWEYIENA